MVLHTDCRIDFQPLGRRIHTQPGTTIFEVARDDRVGLASICAGKGTCGKCKIRILSGEVSPLDDRERKALTAEEIAQGYRLACHTKGYGNVTVDIPVESLAVAQRVQLAGEGEDPVVDTALQILTVSLSPPSREDNRSDQVRLAEHLAEAYGLTEVRIDLYAQRRLSAVLRADEWRAKIALHGGEVVAAGPVGDRLLGVATDLGTTSIAGYLTDLETGEILATKGMMNPQIAYGEDVISRIGYAIEHDGDALRQTVVDGLNRLIGELGAAAGLAREGIAEVVVVGNTAMHHLFLGLPARQLLLAPYVPAVSDYLYTKARDLGLMVSPGAYVYTLPNIAGFVGADHVAMLLASGIPDLPGVTLGLDIGTNTEITLSVQGQLRACSCASGPAFEGAHIRHGMRAVAGAIERVRIDGDRVTVRTINDQPPVGLCGSGILDAVAQLLAGGLIDKMGKLQAHPCIRQTDTGKEFVLTGRDQSGTGKEITLTEKDISEIQLAKGAIASGINILLKTAGIAWPDLENVIIAGAFGTYIDVASAIGIGMLPPLPLPRYAQVGNAAGVGARQALVSKAQRQRAVEIARRVNLVELTGYPGYPSVFAKALRFAPATNWG